MMRPTPRSRRAFRAQRKQLAYFVAHPERVTPRGYRGGVRRRGLSGAPRDRHLETGRRARPGRCRGRGARLRLSRESRPSRGHSPHDRGGDAISAQAGCCGAVRRRHSFDRLAASQGDFMDLKLAGKTALITGGSKGIGRATAEIFAAEGCNVIIVSRSAEALAAAKSAIAQKSNVRVDTVAADLSDSRERRSARQGFSRYRHPGEQCRRHSGRHAARRQRGDLAQGVGPESVRLRQHVPRVLRADEGAQGGRHRQRRRQRSRHARSGIHLRRRRQCGADGVHASRSAASARRTASASSRSAPDRSRPIASSR